MIANYFLGWFTQYETYHPSTGTFSLAGNPSACCGSTATLLMNGNVLVAYSLGFRGLPNCTIQPPGYPPPQTT
jgi:hypothetical protein